MKEKSTQWNQGDTLWVLSLFGTAIGAGVLFLPINAGMGGLIPLLVMLVLAFPMTFLAHRALCRFVLSGSKQSDDITVAGENYFGKFGGMILTVLYFFAIFPILLVYSVGVTNTVEKFMIEQLHLGEPNRLVLSFVLVGILMVIVSFGEKIVVRVMSALVFPFIAVLLLIALWLIPQWNGVLFSNVEFSLSDSNLWMTLWLVMPVMVFAFNHSPIISSLAVHCKETYGKDAEAKASKIIARSNILMIVVVMFFVFSCALCLSPSDLLEAKNQNVSILTYLAERFHTPFIYYVAPVVAFIAMGKSFFGHYLGAREGLNKILFDLSSNKLSLPLANKITAIITFIIAWLVAYKNPSVLGIIESIGGPILAIILFIMPLYAIYRFEVLHKYKAPAQNIFILILGLITISAAINGLIG